MLQLVFSVLLQSGRGPFQIDPDFSVPVDVNRYVCPNSVHTYWIYKCSDGILYIFYFNLVLMIYAVEADNLSPFPVSS